MNTRQTRQYQARAISAASGTGGLSGTALRFGQMDTYCTVFAPGCAPDDVLARFVETGCLLSGHDWDDTPMGIIASASATATGIDIEADFHSTPDAQELRTVITERMDAGKTVGLSIGFRVANFITCSNGAILLQQASALGFDMMAFDTEGIMACMEQCWLITRLAELAEVSVVNFASVPKSGVQLVRQTNESSLGGPHGGLTLKDQLLHALGVVESAVERAKQVAELRKADGKQIGKETQDKLREIRDMINPLIEVEPVEDTEAVKARNTALLERSAEIIKGKRL